MNIYEEIHCVCNKKQAVLYKVSHKNVSQNINWENIMIN